MKMVLPLQVLGWVGPVLCWVEGAEGVRIPQTWLAGLSFDERERAWLVRELPTYSHDNVDEIVEMAYGKRPGRSPLSGRPNRIVAPPPGYELSKVLGQLRRRYFQWSGGELCVREKMMEELHELGRRFPVAHLVRRSHAEAVARGFLSEARALELPERISIIDTNSYGLRSVVERGLSDGHLHLWGVTGAEDTWADQLLQAWSPQTVVGSPFGAPDRRLMILSRHAVRLLAAGVLQALIGERQRPMLTSTLLAGLDELYLARSWPEEDLAQRRLHRDFQRSMRQLLDHVPGWVSRTEIEDLGWILRIVDPATYWMGRRAGKDRLSAPLPSRERISKRIELIERLHFKVQLLLRQLQAESPAVGRELRQRDFLHQCFYRYLVYQTHHWQLMTQHGKTTGLREFKRYYDAPLRRTLDPGGLETQGLVMERLYGSSGVRTVEGRVSPPSGPHDLVPWLLGYAQLTKADPGRKFGIVVNFLKEGKSRVDTKPLPGGFPCVRHGPIRRSTRRKALELFGLLSSAHPVVPFVVGIDAAHLELTTPPEVFAPAFRFLREYPIEVQRKSRFQRFGVDEEIAALVKNRRLGMTYHVGEDFRHLLSGLRAIHEAIEFLAPLPGDRLGHAIALALKPRVWAEQTGFQAILPKQEWLDTLVWTYHLLGPGQEEVGRLDLEERIRRLSREIYSAPGQPLTRQSGGGWAPLTLHDAWHLRQLDPYSFDLRDLQQGRYRVAERVGESVERRRWAQVQQEVIDRVNLAVGSNDAYRLLGLYWFNDATREAGSRITTVDMQPERDLWLRLCVEAQRRLRAILQDRQLVVEVNPSSNRVIGAMSELAEHHIFRMTLDEKNRLARDLRVTINTDDPGVFNTSLAHEYYLLGELVMRNGVPEAEVVEWLEWLRENGDNFSFVHSLPGPDEDCRVARILESLEWNYRRLGREMSGSSGLSELLVGGGGESSRVAA